MTRTGASGIREVFRLAPPIVLWWIWVAFVAANIADYAVQGLPSARFGVALGLGLLLATGVIYALALRPKVIADAAGVTVINPLRSQHIPWSRIESVDTGEWVRIRYTPAPAPAPAPPAATARTVNCWALYVSASSRRKIARGPVAVPRAGIWRRLPSLAQPPGGGATPDARLPEEARYLASLPPAQAIAIRLDTRARRERARG